jgi:hypothetical protein
MTSQFFCKIIIFTLINVPDDCRTAVIIKGTITSNLWCFFCCIYLIFSISGPSVRELLKIPSIGLVDIYPNEYPDYEVNSGDV